MELEEGAGPSVLDGGDPLSRLIAATADGDRAAFARLYASTSPRLLGIGTRLMRSRELAEDVLQETYLKVWHKARLYDPERGSAMVWMITILRRCALDRLRQAGRREEVAVDEPGLDAPELRVSLDPMHAVERQHLRRCLGELADSKRRAIQLAFYYGLTHEELAERMDVPVGTVKSWIRRGLRSLKDCLER